MHMADALISPAVGLVMDGAAAGAIAYSCKKINRVSDKVPTMGVLGAFVFAAQMINFTIPGTGSSGHIAGAVLLAAILGAEPAFLTLCAVLVVQCLFFADGGLLALGCNMINMGFFGCFVAYPLIFRTILKKKITKPRIMAASVLACLAGLELGAFAVVIDTLISGVTELNFATFAALMLPIHVAIGAVEGVITGAVLCFVYQLHPEMLEQHAGRTSKKQMLIGFAAAAVLVAGGLSLVASSNPDGLEWSLENTVGTSELEQEGETYQKASAIQSALSFLPDYSFADGEGGTSVSGLVGGLLTCGAAMGIGGIITAVKKKKKNKHESKTQ